MRSVSVRTAGHHDTIHAWATSNAIPFADAWGCNRRDDRALSIKEHFTHGRAGEWCPVCCDSGYVSRLAGRESRPRGGLQAQNLVQMRITMSTVVRKTDVMGEIDAFIQKFHPDDSVFFHTDVLFDVPKYLSI